MITALIALAALASAPSPPRTQSNDVAAAFKGECISAAGVEIGVRNWTEHMQFVDAHKTETEIIQNELIAARKSNPFDIDRYEKALKALNDDQHTALP